MNVWLAGRRISIKPTQSIGKGGEADVFDLGDGRALKIFKTPDHPDYQGSLKEQQAAKRRLAEHQQKLRQFPKGLPSEVIGPEELATDQSGNAVVGYAMRKVGGAESLFRLADSTFRRGGYPSQDVTRLFAKLHAALAALHRTKVIVGDFNDRNVLVVGTDAKLIDADSFQFAPFVCAVFTDRFVDPLLCAEGQGGLVQVKPHHVDSDWYAFAVLLMQSLLFVGPYGGIFRPKDPAKRIAQTSRPLSRITVFHPEVQYPKPAASLATLPDDLVDRFQRVFAKDERGEFPLSLLEELRFSRCASCHTEHARANCPICRPSAGLPTQVVARVRGEVVCTHLFQTRGLILEATTDGGALRVVYHEDGEFRREDGSVILRGELNPNLRFALCGRDTLVSRGTEVVTLCPANPKPPERIMIDRAPNPSASSGWAFATGGPRRFWIQDGWLIRDGPVGIPERVGEVLAHQTRLWMGPAFGFGLYRAGLLSVALVFEGAKGGINDQLKLPPLPGELLHADCVLDEKRAWLRLALQSNGRTRHLALAWSRTGALDGVAEVSAGDATWLGTLGGACAVGGMLLVATDSGIVRVEIQSGKLVQTREFPDTEPFVSSDCRLRIGPQGLLVVKPREIVALKMT